MVRGGLSTAARRRRRLREAIHANQPKGNPRQGTKLPGGNRRRRTRRFTSYASTPMRRSARRLLTESLAMEPVRLRQQVRRDCPAATKRLKVVPPRRGSSRVTPVGLAVTVPPGRFPEQGLCQSGPSATETGLPGLLRRSAQDCGGPAQQLGVAGQGSFENRRLFPRRLPVRILHGLGEAGQFQVRVGVA